MAKSQTLSHQPATTIPALADGHAVSVATTQLEQNAVQATDFLKLLANKRRLMVLCVLAETGELSVQSLALRAGLSQSAMSQHLARMRAEGLVAYKREGPTLYYHIADLRVLSMLTHLHRLFCSGNTPSQGAKP